MAENSILSTNISNNQTIHLSQSWIHIPKHYPVRYINYEHKCYLQHSLVKSSNAKSIIEKIKDIGLLKEIRILRSIGNHPNVVQYISCTAKMKYSPSITFLMTGYVEKTLDHYRDGIFSGDQEKQYELAKAILSGLAFLHQKNIIHSNINPKSILIPNTGPAKICCFKTAWMHNEIPKGSANMKAVSFLAPEILEGHIYKNSVDLWGFAATMMCKSTISMSPISVQRIRYHTDKHENENRFMTLSHDITSDILSEIFRSCFREAMYRLTAKQCLNLLNKKRKQKNNGQRNLELSVLKLRNELQNRKGQFTSPEIIEINKLCCFLNNFETYNKYVPS